MTFGVSTPRRPDTFPLDNSPGYSDHSCISNPPSPYDMPSTMQRSRLRRKGSVKNLRHARLMYENLYTGPPQSVELADGRMSSTLQENEQSLHDVGIDNSPAVTRKTLYTMRNVPFNTDYLTRIGYITEVGKNDPLSILLSTKRRRSLRGRYPSRNISAMTKVLEEDPECGESISSLSRSDSASTSDTMASASTGMKTTPGTTLGVIKSEDDEEETEIDDENESQLFSDVLESGDEVEEVASPVSEVTSNSLGVLGIDVTSSLNELLSGAEGSPSRMSRDLQPAPYHRKVAEEMMNQPLPAFPPSYHQPVQPPLPMAHSHPRDLRFSATETHSSTTRRASRRSSRPNLRSMTTLRGTSGVTDSFTLSPSTIVSVKPKEPLPIFVYGDLVDPLLLSLLLTGVPHNGGRINKQPATLYGFERRTMKHYNYPAAIPARIRFRRGDSVIYDETAYVNGVILRDLSGYQRQKIKQFYPVVLGSEQDQRMSLFVRTHVRVTLQDGSGDEVDAIAYTWNQHRIGGPVIEFELQTHDAWNSDEFKRNSLDAYLTTSAEDQFRVSEEKSPPIMVTSGKLKKISSQQSGLRTKLKGLSKRR